MRRVMIATPAGDGKVEVDYVFSLVETVKLGIQKDIQVIPMWIKNESLLQSARNDLFKFAIDMDADDMVFIDADECWNPEKFFSILEHDVDCVGFSARKKSFHEEYVIKSDKTEFVVNDGLIEVLGIGTGFMRLSKKAYRHLWDNSEPYNTPRGEQRYICQLAIDTQTKTLISEDIFICNKLIQGGFKVYLDVTHTCDHFGSAKYSGDVLRWLNQNYTIKHQ